MDQFDPSEKNIKKLCRQAFDESQDNSEESRTALKSLANTLLLHSDARQAFVNTGYAGKAADRLKIDGNNREEEITCSRILFLLTYNTDLDFSELFDDHTLADNVHNNVAFNVNKYEELEKAGKERDFDGRPLVETLKLLFNVTKFYPDRTPAFTKTIQPILRILQQIHLPSPTFQSPAKELINALLNLDLPGEVVTAKDGKKNSPLFPTSTPSCHTERLILILEQGIYSEREVERLEILATPTISVLRRVNAIAPLTVRKMMQDKLLPSNEERAQPLGRSDTLASRLLRLTTSPATPQLKEAISSLLFELSDNDAVTFMRNVGYGYAAGFLVTHNIPVPESLLHKTGDEVTTVEGQEINPITGQRRDMEPEDPGPEMTDTEKEREAEKLFVLFERLKATGVVKVVNPVEQAANEGRFEEVD